MKYHLGPIINFLTYHTLGQESRTIKCTQKKKEKKQHSKINRYIFALL